MELIQPSPKVSSGTHLSVWLETAEQPVYESLHADFKTDVLVIGAGISGLSVAYCLAKEGRQVTVLEDGFIGSGETGRTTAHIVNALDDRYSEIERMFGEEKSRLAAESHTEAIHFIERVIHEENIDCDFIRLDGYLFLHPSDKLKSLQEELDATHRAGLPTEWLESVPGMAAAEGPCIRFPDQAQFHPLKYLYGLAKAATRFGAKIFTNTKVTAFGKNSVEANGFTVQATHIVVCTNTPINDRVTMHTKQHPYRTYVITAKVPKGSVTPALWWDTGNMNSVWPSDPYHYVRTQPYNEQYDLLICGGEDHKTGQAEKEEIPEDDRYDNLERWLTQRFPMIESIGHVWSGQVMEPVDALGFIGKNPGDENVYIATGDSGNGMTHGTIAGMLICDLVQGRENPWASLYDPSRITFAAASSFIQEVSNMAAQYLDYITPGDLKSMDTLTPQQGAIIRMGARKVAVYKDEQSVIHVFSAVCPHLGCYVRWNGDEKSFDCPCHGSRFTCQGVVTNGPATSNLKRLDVKEHVNGSIKEQSH